MVCSAQLSGKVVAKQLVGFLSRDGITTFAEAANAVQTAYGFAYDLSTFLSALAVIAGGDLATGYYSIGGADARVPNTLGPALGLDKHGAFSLSRQEPPKKSAYTNKPIQVHSRLTAP